MATLTPRGYPKPDIGGDADVWGGQLHTGIDLMDGDVTANETAITDLETSLRQLMVDLQNQQDQVGMVKWINNSDPLPPAWAECDGSNGTPDLRERVLVAVSNSQRGRQRGSKVWSQNSQTSATTPDFGHQHDMKNGVAVTADGDTQETVLTRSHLPSEPLSINHAAGTGNSYVTTRTTSNPIGDYSGSGTDFYIDSVVNTENLGSGLGHKHNLVHNHAIAGITEPEGEHDHSVSVPVPSSYGMRAIQKIRLLTVGDLP